MPEILTYGFMQKALAASLLASVACGVIGTFVVVKRIVSMSGGISHAAYGGVGLGYMLGVPPLAGAAVFSLLGAFGIGLAHRRFEQASDTVIGMIWAVGMALGIIFVSLTPGAVPDLMTYLFGDILTVSSFDVYMMLALDAIILVLVALLYKELLAVAYDEEFAQVLRLPVEFIYFLLLALIALTVIALIRVVGIILVIALLSLPPATARIYVRRMGSMMGLSVVVGGVCSLAGLALSYHLEIPSGPVIILSAAVVYTLSVLYSKMARN